MTTPILLTIGALAALAAGLYVAARQYAHVMRELKAPPFADATPWEDFLRAEEVAHLRNQLNTLPAPADDIDAVARALGVLDPATDDDLIFRQMLREYGVDETLTVWHQPWWSRLAESFLAWGYDRLWSLEDRVYAKAGRH